MWKNQNLQLKKQQQRVINKQTFINSFKNSRQSLFHLFTQSHQGQAMRYRQDTRVKSDRKKLIGSQGKKVQQIIFDKEITQEWQVKTSEPTEILPYTLKRLCLSRMCEFWHQMKFFYFENYQETTKDQQQQWGKQSNLLQDWQQSVILVRVTAQRAQQCRRFLKTVWKLARQRLMSAMIKIKHHGGVQDDSSLQIQEQKLNSYMRFLKLQENKRIDIAIQTIESVIEKNTKKKLLNAFLNIRQRVKEVKRYQIYRDRMKIECFVDIVMRSIRRQNVGIMKCAFDGIEMNRRRMRRVNKIGEVNTSAMSGKKVDIKQVLQDSSHQKDTVNKLKKNLNQQHDKMQSHQKLINNQQSTIKRQLITRQKHIIIDRNNIKDHSYADADAYSDTDNRIKSISSHEHIISQQYYDDDVGRQSYDNYAQSDCYYDEFNRKNNKRNDMPTRRVYHHQRNVNNINDYTIEEFQQNDHLENNSFNIMHKKTARTPSRIQQNYYHSQNLLSQQQQLRQSMSQHQTAKYLNIQHELHIPVTQRVERHFYEENYEEQEEQSMSSQREDSENDQNVHQQICVIRNTSSTPNRKPDRYQKIPIISNNIDFRQYFVNSSKKKQKNIEVVSTHSSNYYERKSCEGCQYCIKLKKMNEMMELLQKNRIINTKTQFQTEIVSSQNINLYQKVIQNRNVSNNPIIVIKSPKINTEKLSEPEMISKKEQLNAFSKKASQEKNVANTQVIIMDSSKASNDSKKNQKKQQSQKNRSFSKNQKSSSFVLKYVRGSGLAPSRQSMLTKSTYSKGHSEKKIFSRKPMY